MLWCTQSVLSCRYVCSMMSWHLGSQLRLGLEVRVRVSAEAGIEARHNTHDDVVCIIVARMWYLHGGSVAARVPQVLGQFGVL